SLLNGQTGARVTAATGSGVARIPGSGAFTLTVTGPYIIETTSFATNQTGSYTLALGDTTTPFPVAGTVTKDTGGGLAGVTITFSRVTGTGAIPAPVMTDASGGWIQTGFVPGTTYQATPSLATYAFTPLVSAP